MSLTPTVYAVQQLPSLNIQLIPCQLSYKYYLNSVTRAVSQHTATVLSCYRIHITLTQSHVRSVNTQLPSCRAVTKYYVNTVTRCAAIQPVLSHCAVTRHITIAGWLYANNYSFATVDVLCTGRRVGCRYATHNSEFKNTNLLWKSHNQLFYVTYCLGEINRRTPLWQVYWKF